MEVTWYGVYAIGFMSMFHILVLYINTVSYSVSLSKCLGLRQRSLSHGKCFVYYVYRGNGNRYRFFSIPAFIIRIDDAGMDEYLTRNSVRHTGGTDKRRYRFELRSPRKRAESLKRPGLRFRYAVAQTKLVLRRRPIVHRPSSCVSSRPHSLASLFVRRARDESVRRGGRERSRNWWNVYDIVKHYCKFGIFTAGTCYNVCDGTTNCRI